MQDCIEQKIVSAFAELDNANKTITELKKALIARDAKIEALTAQVARLTQVQYDSLPEIDPYER